MAFENSAGINVSNYYGPRNTGQSVGVERSTDSIHQLSVFFTHEDLENSYLPPVVMPKGAKVLRYLLVVDEAFTLTSDTTATVQIGSAGSVATNGVSITGTELSTTGAKTPASTGLGTWATSSTTGLGAAAKVAKALGGTNTAVTPGAGQATLLVEYVYKTRTV